jgi:hypothetical protein
MAQEKIKEAIFDYIDQSDIEDGFNLDVFIEDLTTKEDAVFILLEDEILQDVDIELNDEGVDNIIHDYIETSSERAYINDDDDDDDEVEDFDDNEEEPEIYLDDEEEE